jgi:hypothetical protein
MNKPRRDLKGCQGREGVAPPAPYKCYASEEAGKYTSWSRADLGGKHGENTAGLLNGLARSNADYRAIITRTRPEAISPLLPRAGFLFAP